MDPLMMTIVTPRYAAGLCNLPTEIVLEISSHLSTDDFKQLRNVCKRLDAALLASFGKSHFARLHLMPTSVSLAILTRISTEGRLGAYFWGARQTGARPEVRWTKPRLRVLKELERPFSSPSSPEEEIANVCVELVRGDGFRNPLTEILKGLCVQRIEVQAWPRYPLLAHGLKRLAKVPSLTLGLKDVTQSTGRNPFEGNFSGIRPAWEYETMNMVTRMTNIVLSAVRDSGMPLVAMITDKIQIDLLKFSSGLEHGLSHLKNLEFSIDLSDQSLRFSNPTNRFDIFALVNELPSLDHLGLFAYGEQSWLHLDDALMHVRSRTVTKLRLGLLWDAVPQLVPFLRHSLPSLRDLKLEFTISLPGNKAWNELFSALREDLSLDRLMIDIDGHEFESFTSDQIDSTLVWLAENMPDHWKGYISEEITASFCGSGAHRQLPTSPPTSTT
ncbi:hypothetical protein E4T39_02782 [Aureobasidium subglaciale]|nr:hypothetical protein E4T39_02782 [Aureobasidium subglaciale]